MFGYSPFFKKVGIIGGELTSTPSVTPNLSILSLDLLDGVDYLLDPSVNLLPEATSLGAILEPPTPDANGFFGLFFVGFSGYIVVL